MQFVPFKMPDFKSILEDFPSKYDAFLVSTKVTFFNMG